MRVLNLILGIDGVYISLWMNEMNNVKYEWTNEVDSVFAKEGPRVEVPYVGKPSPPLSSSIGSKLSPFIDIHL